MRSARLPATRCPGWSSCCRTPTGASASGPRSHSAKSASLPALDELLADRDRDVRRSAAGALGGIGPPARDAIHSLARLLSDRDESVKLTVVFALHRIEHPDWPRTSEEPEPVPSTD